MIFPTYLPVVLIFPDIFPIPVFVVPTAFFYLNFVPVLFVVQAFPIAFHFFPFVLLKNYFYLTNLVWNSDFDYFLKYFFPTPFLFFLFVYLTLFFLFPSSSILLIYQYFFAHLIVLFLPIV